MDDRVLVKKATADLTGKEGYAVKLDTDKNYVVIATAVTDEVVGVVKRGNTLGKEVEIVVWGYCPLACSDTVAEGEYATLRADATFDGGKADGSVFCGMFMQAGVSGDLVPGFVFPAARHELG